MSYDKEHVSMDEYDVPASLHCVKCNKVIARRHEIPSERFPGQVNFTIIRTAEYTEKYAELSDNSVMYVPMCKECAKSPMDHEGALNVIKRTWETELRQKGRPESAIEQFRASKEGLHIVKSEG